MPPFIVCVQFKHFCTTEKIELKLPNIINPSNDYKARYVHKLLKKLCVIKVSNEFNYQRNYSSTQTEQQFNFELFSMRVRNGIYSR